MSAPPKPPPGFKMVDSPDEESATPPPPPGFKLVDPAVKLPAGGEGLFESGSKSGAALRGFGQGASLGFTDELNGAVVGLTAGFSRAAVDLLKTAGGRALMRSILGKKTDALPDAAVDALTEGSAQQSARDTLGFGLPTTEGDSDAALMYGYRKGRNASRLENVQSQKSHPYVYGGAQLAGAVASPGPNVRGLVGAAKVVQVAKTGFAQGAAGALGSSDADLTRYETEPQVLRDSAGDVATGAAMGGVLAPLASVAGDRATPALRRLSQNAALRAMGVRAGISDQLGKRGYETADQARELGQAALDMELIRPFRTATDVAERAGFAREVQGARIEGALSDADALGRFDADRASWDAVNSVVGGNGLSPAAIDKSRGAQRLVQNISDLPRVQEPTFANANRMKSDIYNGINYATDPTLKTTMERRAASGLRQSIEDQIAETAGPDVADELRAANRQYGYLSDILPLAQEESTRQLGRTPWYSPTVLGSAVVAGAGGNSMGGPVGGALGALAPVVAKGLAPRAASTMALGARSMSGPLRDSLQPLGRSAFEAGLNLGAKPAVQAPLRPSLDEQEQDAIQAFLSGG